jgi:hypothetical protein
MELQLFGHAHGVDPVAAKRGEQLVEDGVRLLVVVLDDGHARARCVLIDVRHDIVMRAAVRERPSAVEAAPPVAERSPGGATPNRTSCFFSVTEERSASPPALQAKGKNLAKFRRATPRHTSSNTSQVAWLRHAY